MADQLWTPAFAPAMAGMLGAMGDPTYLGAVDDEVLGLDDALLGGESMADQMALLGAGGGSDQMADQMALLGAMSEDQLLGAARRGHPMAVRVVRQMAAQRRNTLPQNPWLARETLRSRARALQDTKRQSDNYTPLGVEQVFTAAQSTTITVTPTEPFTPARIWFDPSVAPFFKITSGSIGSKNIFGSSGPIRATSWALDRPVEIGWPSFSPTRPLVLTCTSLDGVNSRTAIFTIYGSSHQSVG